MDKFWERYIQSRPAPGTSKGAFDAFAAARRDPGPRNMYAGGQLVQNTVDGSRPGYGGKYGTNIRKSSTSNSFEVQIIRGGKKFYDTFTWGEYKTGKKPVNLFKTKKEALNAAKAFRNEPTVLPKETGKQSKGQPIGFKKQIGGQAEIRKALNDIIEVGGKSFSNEDIRKLVDMDLFPDDDQFRKAVDVVKKEPEFKNLTFEKKPRPRLRNDPVSVLQAKARVRRKKKLDILGSREYEKELYQYKKEVQEGLGLKPAETTGAISGKKRKFLPIDMGHQSSIDQLKALKQKLRPEDLGPQFYRANREGIRKYEGGVRTLEANLKKDFYPEQKKLYNQAKKFIDAGKEVPADLQNKIINSNERIQIFIDDTVKKYPLLKDRVKAITIDAGNLTVKRGENVLTELGIGLVDQDLGNIKIGSIDDLTIKANLAEQTLKEAVDTGLIDEKAGREKLDKFMGKKDLSTKVENILKKKGVPAGERGFIATAMLDDFGKMGFKGLKLLNWLQLEYDVAFESLIYDYHRRYAGHEPGLAREALFLPKILAKYFPDLSKLPFVGGLFEPYEAGILEGPAEVLEKRLYERKDDEGKVIGENKLIKSYIDNNKRMEEISSKYRSLEFKKDAPESGRWSMKEDVAHPRLDPIAKIENQQAILADEYKKLEQLNKPDALTGYHTAHTTALEKQDTEYGVKAPEAHKKRLGVVDIPWDIVNPNEMLNYNQNVEKRLERAQERFESEQADKRRKAIEDKYPTLTKSQIDKMLEASGYVIDPNIAKYKKDLEFLTKEDILTKYHPAFPPGVKTKPVSTYDMIKVLLSDEDKLAYFADNFRVEKAGGGIVGIRRPSALPPTGGPMSQGLRSLYNNVKKS